MQGLGTAHYAALIGLAIGLFATTNIDDLFVLLSFFADPKFQAREIAIGQFAGLAVLYCVSVAGSLIALVVSPVYVGLLGLVPIYLGTTKIWKLYKHADTPGQAPESQASTSIRHGNVFAVAAVTVANGGDNISIYLPLFATRSASDIALIGVVFGVMTFVCIAAAYWLTNHKTIGAPIRRYGPNVVPFVLVILGFLVLREAGSFTLLRSIF